jgi:arginine N-succinyltransferase
MIVANANPNAGFIDLSNDELALLHCGVGDAVRTLPLNLRKNVHG